MDPIRNPYAPGAGTPPPVLAGRDDLLDQAHLTLARIRAGRHAKSLILIGRHGVGKTVLLDRIALDAEAEGAQIARMEATDGRSLPALLAPQLRTILLKFARHPKAKLSTDHALAALAGFATAMKASYPDIEVSLDADAQPGLADNGALDADLASLLDAAGEAANAAQSVIVLLCDELHHLPEEQLGALIMALHRCVQRRLPVVMLGAGLPQVRQQLGDVRSYAERLFDFPVLDELPECAAKQAILQAAQDEGVTFTEGALQELVRQTRGHPYFLQEWARHTWEVAAASPITADDVHQASAIALAALDQSFFLTRYDRLTPSEKNYARAMAQLGPGPHRSGDIANVLGRPVSSLAPIRQALIHKGIVWSPGYGETAFSFPLFDEFMRRVMPRPVDAAA